MSIDHPDDRMAVGSPRVPVPETRLGSTAPSPDLWFRSRTRFTPTSGTAGQQRWRRGRPAGQDRVDGPQPDRNAIERPRCDSGQVMRYTGVKSFGHCTGPTWTRRSTFNSYYAARRVVGSTARKSGPCCPASNKVLHILHGNQIERERSMPDQRAVERWSYEALLSPTPHQVAMLRAIVRVAVISASMSMRSSVWCASATSPAP